MKVLIICEDHVNDQYMIKPIISAMLRKLRKHADIIISDRPRLRGVADALDWETLSRIMDRYAGYIDLYFLCVDRDGRAGRRTALDSLETRAASKLSPSQRFVAENAWQEIEVWVLAGHTDLPATWQWQDIRNEINPKEVYFVPYAQQRGMQDALAQGRQLLAIEAARRYTRIQQRCPELQELEQKIRS